MRIKKRIFWVALIAMLAALVNIVNIEKNETSNVSLEMLTAKANFWDEWIDNYDDCGNLVFGCESLYYEDVIGEESYCVIACLGSNPIYGTRPVYGCFSGGPDFCL